MEVYSGKQVGLRTFREEPEEVPVKVSLLKRAWRLGHLLHTAKQPGMLRRAGAEVLELLGKLTHKAIVSPFSPPAYWHHTQKMSVELPARIPFRLIDVDGILRPGNKITVGHIRWKDYQILSQLSQITFFAVSPALAAMVSRIDLAVERKPYDVRRFTVNLHVVSRWRVSTHIDVHHEMDDLQYVYQELLRTVLHSIYEELILGARTE